MSLHTASDQKNMEREFSTQIEDESRRTTLHIDVGIMEHNPVFLEVNADEQRTTRLALAGNMLQKVLGRNRIEVTNR